MNHCVPCTILLIDKCPQDRAKITRYLQQDSIYNYKIVEFSIAKEALSWCQEKTPVILLLDVASVSENASVFLEKLRSKLSNSQFTLILLIKPEDENLAVRAMKSGVQDYLVKNQITPEILQRVIRHGAEKMYLMQQLAQTKAALQESEERWQLVHGSNDGIWDWNLKTNEVFFSARWKQIRGFTEDEISYSLEEWTSRIHPDDRDRIMKAIADYFAHKTPFFQEEYRVLHQDGSYLWVLNRGQALWDELGNATRMSSSETDITKHKKTEEALRESEHRYATLAEAAPVAIFRLDADGNCIYVNDRWSQMTGKPIQAALGRGCVDTIHSEDRDRHH